MISNVCSEMKSLPIYILSPGSNFFQVFDSYFVSSFKALFVSKHTIHSNMNPGQNGAVTRFSISRCSSYPLDRTTQDQVYPVGNLMAKKGLMLYKVKTVSTTPRTTAAADV